MPESDAVWQPSAHVIGFKKGSFDTREFAESIVGANFSNTSRVDFKNEIRNFKNETFEFKNEMRMALNKIREGSGESSLTHRAPVD